MHKIPFALKFSYKLKVLKYSLQVITFLTGLAEIKQQNLTQFIFLQDIFMDRYNDKEFLYVRYKLLASQILKIKLKPIIETAKETFWTNFNIFKKYFLKNSKIFWKIQEKSWIFLKFFNFFVIFYDFFQNAQKEPNWWKEQLWKKKSNSPKKITPISNGVCGDSNPIIAHY